MASLPALIILLRLAEVPLPAADSLQHVFIQFYGITKVGAAAASVAVTAHRHCCGNERERLQEQEQQEQQRSSSSSVLVPLDTRQPTWCMEHRLQELKTSNSNLADKQAHMGLAASAD